MGQHELYVFLRGHRGRAFSINALTREFGVTRSSVTRWIRRLAFFREIEVFSGYGSGQSCLFVRYVSFPV